jgi:steroid delta-isomerase-like uncharacterized protein
MSIDTNKQIVRRFFDEVLTKQSRPAIAELIDLDLVLHHPMLPNGIGSQPDFTALLATLRKAFPDLKYTVDDLVAEGDKVAARWTARGTYSGELPGAPPGKGKGVNVKIGGNDIFAIANHRIKEIWACSDLLGLMRQIGASRN